MYGLLRDFYMNLFARDEHCDPSLSLKNYFPQLPGHVYEEINRPFTKEDIRIALFEMDPRKSPGPDGIHAAFYQKLWPMIGDSLYEFAANFFLMGKFPDDVNDTLIIFIPMVPAPKG